MMSKGAKMSENGTRMESKIYPKLSKGAKGQPQGGQNSTKMQLQKNIRKT